MNALTEKVQKVFTSPERLLALQEKCFQKVCSSSYSNTQIILAAELEMRGGPCPKCGVPFHQRAVSYTAADGTVFGPTHHYEPACRCFPQCDKTWFTFEVGRRKHYYWTAGCGRYLIAETFLGIDYCTRCREKSPSYDRRERATKKAERDGKAAASGEGATS